MDPKILSLFHKFQQLNVMHAFLSSRGSYVNISMLQKISISSDDLSFFCGLDLLRVKKDQIVLNETGIKKRKRDHKEQIIISRNNEFKSKVACISNMNVDLFIQSMIDLGNSNMFSSDFFISFSPIDRMIQLISQIKQQEFYTNQIAHVKSSFHKDPVYSDCIINPRLLKTLKHKGINKLYSHQVDAINSIRNNNSTVVSTSTSSGKSIIYQIPTIEMLLNQANSTFLYLFPTKALSNDQLANMKELLNLLELEVVANTYDGDTLQKDRRLIRSSSQIIYTNPDMLHLSILQHHEKWSQFLSNLKYLILDECHVYKGSFGQHLVYIIKRLKRLCAYYNNSNVLFLGFSATIANPLSHFSALISNPATAITIDASPIYPRHLVLWNPPLFNSARMTGTCQAVELVVFLTRRRIKVLVFTATRHQTEILLIEIHKSFANQGFEKYSSLVKSYRGGYQPGLRREIEMEFKTGKLMCVVCTNALELGVDIGDIDVVIHLSFPGIDSYYQQMGRAGRRRDSMSILIANGENVLDQYYMNNPSKLYQLKSMPICFSNHIMLQYIHAACASLEKPLNVNEYRDFISEESSEYKGYLVNDDKEYYYNRKYFSKAPHEYVNVRGEVRNECFKIINMDTSEIIEEMEPTRAMYMLHEEGILMHSGNSYMINLVSYVEKTALVRKVNVDYYTRVDDIVDVDPFSCKNLHTDCIKSGTVVLKCKIYGYSKLQHGTDRLKAKVAISPISWEKKINGCWLDIPTGIIQEINKEDDQLIYSSTHAVNHLIMHILTSTLGSEGEVRCECRDENAKRPRPGQLMFYESQVAGYSEILGNKLKGFLKIALKILYDCECENGCINCIHYEKCKSRNGSLSKFGAFRLLEFLVKEIEK
eukprot:NODE_310_length_11257_cov_0.344417.p1 type:complete len:878 gc:universal NODE_310_length_11257_cov_0.344417:2153-4786(+)